MFTLHQTVALVREIPEAGLQSGNLGAIVTIHEGGSAEVEFVAASGRTQAVLTLPLGSLRAIGDQDLIAVHSPIPADR